jgi:carbon monoxide dehydrogenase subunit G
MPTYRETIEIDAEAEATWRVLGDLASVQHWVPGVVAVELTENGRACTFADGRVQHEEITDYSPEQHSFRYVIDGGLPVRDNRGSFAVEPQGDRSLVVWESSFEPLDPGSEQELMQMWRGAVSLVLENLQRLVEKSVATR